jgi:hypothetical protein
MEHSITIHKYKIILNFYSLTSHVNVWVALLVFKKVFDRFIRFISFVIQ